MFSVALEKLLVHFVKFWENEFDHLGKVTLFLYFNKYTIGNVELW